MNKTQGLDLINWVPDYTKTLEENQKDFREKYYEVYKEYPPEPQTTKSK